MTKNKPERQPASQSSARHSGEGRNPELAPNLPEPFEGDAADESAIGMVPLKCVSSQIADGSHNPPPKQTSGVPMLSARNISEIGIAFDDFRFITREAFELERKRVDLLPGDVLLTIVGSIGRAAVVPESPRQFAIQRSVAVIRPRGLDSKFCMYQLRSDRVQKWLREHARGSAQQGVYLKTLANLPVLAVPLARQRQVVAEIEKQFTRLDAGVAALRRVQANLKRYRAAVLKAACEGRLVPTEAELAKTEGRTYDTGEQLLARILADRRKNWNGRGKYKELAAPVTTNLPPLPDGWVWAACAQIGEAITGFTPPKSNPEFFGGDVPFFKPTDLDAGYNVREFRDSLTEAGALHGRVLPPQSILVTCIGATIGKTGLARVRCATNQQINALVISEEPVSPKYVYWYFCGPLGQRQILDNASATTLPILNKSRFEALPIPLPPLVEQERIVAGVERRLSVIEELETAVTANLQRATRLRQSVLQRAFSEQ